MLVQARVLAATLFHFFWGGSGGRWGAGIETNTQIKKWKKENTHHSLFVFGIVTD